MTSTTLGLSEVARIRAEMETLKDARSAFAGKLEDFFVFLRSDDRFYVANDDAGRADLPQKAAEAYLAGMRARLPEQFGRLPKADLIVKRVEAFREEPGGAAHYSPAALDGSRPGIFYVHLADTRATPTYEIEGTVYHEGHARPSYADRARAGDDRHARVPEKLFLRRLWRGLGALCRAAREGDGLLHRSLQRLRPAGARDLARDPPGGRHRHPREGMERSRGAGLITRPIRRSRLAKIRSEIRRYFVTPGQATSYKVGMQRILALREKAKAALGALLRPARCSTRSCSGADRCRCRCSRRRSTAGSPRPA
jgi:hypothetical protein